MGISAMKLTKHIRAKCAVYKKKKFIFFFLLSSIFSFVCFAGCNKPQAFEFYEFPFATSDGGIISYYCIYRYNGNEESVVIPDTHKGCEVRYILDDAFRRRRIKEIDVGLVKQIYPRAFEYCRFLERVHLNDMEQIYRGAFLGCSSLETITIPSSVWKIEDSAFGDCDSLTSVYFEGNPTWFGERIFSKNPNLTVFGPAGGALEEYVLSEGIAFEIWDGAV